jgi:hypothetical protein
MSRVPALSILGIIAFTLGAIFSCKLWYKRQAAWDQLALSNRVDQDVKLPLTACGLLLD